MCLSAVSGCQGSSGVGQDGGLGGPWIRERAWPGDLSLVSLHTFFFNLPSFCSFFNGGWTLGVLPAPEARLGHLWHEAYLEGEVSAGAASRAVQNSTFLGPGGGGWA